MSLIEQLGGYESVKGFYERAAKHGFKLIEIRDALLEYRREHGIFEINDKVVYVDDFMHDEVLIVSNVDDRVWLNDDAAVCIKDMGRHATDLEIAAGRRLS